MTSGGIVQQYRDLRGETDADLLAMQMGDFYEFFEADAREVGDVLDLKVSQRSAGGETYDMAGVPVDELTPYLRALVERGYRVAVADQHETEDSHARAIERIVTPGTALETADGEAQYLAAVVRDGDDFGLAFLDITTGRFHVTSVADDSAEAAKSRALTECYRFAPTELLPGPDLRNDDAFLDGVSERSDATLTLHDTEAFAPGRARHAVREQFGGVQDSVGLEDDAAIRAAGAAVAYARETGATALASVTRLHTYAPDDHVALDATTQRNLELTEPMTGAGRSLFDVLDHTETAAGGRRLRAWLTRPLRRRGELARRQSAVAALTEDAMARERLRETLKEAYDLERLASRAVSGSADAGALLRVRETLALLPTVAATIEDSDRLADSPLAALVDVDREVVAELRDALDALADDPPSTLTDGGLFACGFDDELDALVERWEDAVDWIDSLAERERARTGISRLSVGRNATDGYYIEVVKSECDAVPDEYEGIKTLKNSERYVHPELEAKEREILRIEERRGELEYELFRDLRERVAAAAELLQDVGASLAELDALASLAAHAVRNDWTRPKLTDGDELVVEAGRHPVVEQSTEFVPNDLQLNADRRFLLVTGPNMSGKSTYMRQVALITLLAQVGSFVPADTARVGLVDGIFTRVGALDELAGGRSTFMVEMGELANILHTATEDSLVVLDEVGRGTATYDGISIAWAATEYLHNEVRAKTLFATHYHELTELADRLDRVANVHVAVAEAGDDVRFLRSVEPGSTNRSYGVHVADLAGVPGPVVDRSRQVLDRLRREKAIEARGSSDGEAVQTTFDLSTGTFRDTDRASADGGNADETPDGRAHDPETAAVLDELVDVDVNETPPVELLARVREWQRRLDD